MKLFTRTAQKIGPVRVVEYYRRPPALSNNFGEKMYRVSYGGFLIAGWHAHAAVCVGMLAGGANDHAQQTACWACHPRK